MKLGAEEVDDADDLPEMDDGADFLRRAGHLTTPPPPPEDEEAALRASQQLVHTVLLRFMTETLPPMLWKEKDDDLGRDLGDDVASADETALASS